MTRLQTLATTTAAIRKTTVADMAATLGVSRQHLHRLLAGRSVPSLELAFRLAKLLGRTVPDLWHLTEVGIRARASDNRRR